MALVYVSLSILKWFLALLSGSRRSYFSEIQISFLIILVNLLFILTSFFSMFLGVVRSVTFYVSLVIILTCTICFLFFPSFLTCFSSFSNISSFNVSFTSFFFIYFSLFSTLCQSWVTSLYFTSSSLFLIDFSPYVYLYFNFSRWLSWAGPRAR